MSRAYSTQHDETKRADMVGASVTVLEGKARDYALKHFWGKDIPGVRRDEVVVQPSGLPTDLDLLPIGSLK